MNKLQNGQNFIPMKNLLNIVTSATEEEEDVEQGDNNNKKNNKQQRANNNCGLSSKCYSKFLPAAGMITVMLGLSTFFGISLGVVNDNQIGYYRGNTGSYIPPGVYFQMPWHTGKLQVTDVFNKSFIIEKIDIPKINTTIRCINFLYDIRDPLTFVRKLQTYDLETLYTTALRDTFIRAVKSDIGSDLIQFHIFTVCKEETVCNIKTTIFLDTFGIELHHLSFNMYDVYKLRFDNDDVADKNV